MADLISLLPFIAAVMAIGAVAGVLAGLLGVGGGIVLVPAYFYCFAAIGYGGDQLMQVCVATSLATIIVTSARSVQSHAKKGAVDWELLRSWAPGIVLGAVFGVLVAARVPSLALQVVFGAAALVVSLYMVFGKADWRLANDLPAAPTLHGVSGSVGLLSVLMGIGGGTFGVPLLTLFGMAIHRAVATAAGFGLIIAIPATVGFVFVPVEAAPPLTVGAINLPAFALTIAMTLLTAPLGVSLAHRLDPKPLKRVFGAFLGLVALNMLAEVALG